jgi:hypothetical protein
MTTREGWLLAAVEELRPLFAEQGHEIENVRVSVGFPKGGRGKGAHAIGQCWHRVASADEHHEIFISPELADAARVLDVLAHEVAHAVLPDGTAHKRPFAALVRAIGLEGKATATVAGEAFLAWAAEPLAKLGAYPHATLTPGGTVNGTPKQTTRMLKLECPSCGMVMRTTAKWLDAAGLPTCADGAEFELK